MLGTKITVGGGELETFRGDLRHASVFGGRPARAQDQRRLQPERHWCSRSRTLADGTSLQKEYADATDEPVGLTREVVPLFGQTADPATGDACGDRDPLKNAYGSGRLDYYLDNGSVLSVDGGASQVQNEIFVTGIGRVQVAKAIKPYARVAMAADRYNIFAYWNSRTSIDPQVSLPVGPADLEERCDIFHLEGQNNWNFNGDRGRVVCGASVRNTRVNTSGTLMNPADDDRSDNQGSVYGQVEYKVVPQVRVVGAARVDDGDLFDTQFSPRAPWCTARTRITRSGSRSTTRSRRRTTRSSSSRFPSRRRTPPRPSSRAESSSTTPPSARAFRRGARRAHHHRRSAVELFSDHSGAGARQLRSQGREGDRLGVRL